MSVTFLTDKDKILRYDEQNLTDEQKAQARENIGVSTRIAAIDEKYFDITDDGMVSLRPEYRGRSVSGAASAVPYSISDNGEGKDGSKNAELPELSLALKSKLNRRQVKAGTLFLVVIEAVRIDNRIARESMLLLGSPSASDGVSDLEIGEIDRLGEILKAEFRSLEITDHVKFTSCGVDSRHGNQGVYFLFSKLKSGQRAILIGAALKEISKRIEHTDGDKDHAVILGGRQETAIKVNVRNRFKRSVFIFC